MMKETTIPGTILEDLARTCPSQGDKQHMIHKTMEQQIYIIGNPIGEATNIPVACQDILRVSNNPISIREEKQ
jgi:hypothetical protein